MKPRSVEHERQRYEVDRAVRAKFGSVMAFGCMKRPNEALTRLLASPRMSQATPKRGWTMSMSAISLPALLE